MFSEPSAATRTHNGRRFLVVELGCHSPKRGWAREHPLKRAMKPTGEGIKCFPSAKPASC
jgi:hypothetical protein